MLSAVLIGMAYPWVVEPVPTWPGEPEDPDEPEEPEPERADPEPNPP